MEDERITEILEELGSKSALNFQSLISELSELVTKLEDDYFDLQVKYDDLQQDLAHNHRRITQAEMAGWRESDYGV